MPAQWACIGDPPRSRRPDQHYRDSHWTQYRRGDRQVLWLLDAFEVLADRQAALLLALMEVSYSSHGPTLERHDPVVCPACIATAALAAWPGARATLQPTAQEAVAYLDGIAARAASHGQHDQAQRFLIAADCLREVLGTHET